MVAAVFWVPSTEHPIVSEILHSAPMRALDPQVNVGSVQPGVILERSDVETGRGIAVADDGAFELRRWTRGHTFVQARADHVRPFVLELVSEALSPEKDAIGFDETPGVDARVDDQSVELRWGDGHWVRFASGGPAGFLSVVPLMRMLAASDEDIAASIVAPDGHPVFPVGRSWREAAADAGIDLDHLDLESWPVWRAARAQ